MKSLGYIGYEQNLSKTNHLPPRNRDFRDFPWTVPYDKDAYRIILGTRKNIMASMSRYSKPILEYPIHDIDEVALRYTIRHFSCLFGEQQFTPLPAVRYTTDASPGFYARSAGLKTKNEAIAKLLPYLSTHPPGWETGYVPIFMASPKVEQRKMSKIETDAIRTFIIPDVEFHVYSAQIHQHFNDALAAMAYADNFWSAVGFCQPYGGMDRLASKLIQFKYIGEGDIVLWDCDQNHWEATVCQAVRLSCADDRSKFVEAMNWYYFHAMRSSIIVLPTGEVLLKQVGANSGVINTSDDGTIAHVYAFFRMILRLYPLATYDWVINNVYARMMSDDHVWGCTEDASLMVPFETRQKLYGELNLTLKQEADFVSESIVGHSFLGRKWSSPTEHHCDYDKMMCSLQNTKSDMDRICGVAFQCAYSERYYEEIRKYAAWYARKYQVPNMVPLREEALRIWRGYE